MYKIYILYMIHIFIQVYNILYIIYMQVYTYMLYILCILYISKYFMFMKYTYFSAYIYIYIYILLARLSTMYEGTVIHFSLRKSFIFLTKYFGCVCFLMMDACVSVETCCNKFYIATNRCSTLE
jgi:hypothetical protein